MHQVPTLSPWEQPHCHGVTCTALGWVPTASSTLRPQVLPEHHGHGRGSPSPPARQTEHPSSSFSSLALPAPRCPGTDTHSSHTAPGWTCLQGSRCPVASFLLPPGQCSQICQQHPGGHCATGASLAAGMCPQGLQVLAGHVAARAQQVKVHLSSTCGASGRDTAVPTVGNDGTNVNRLFQVSCSLSLLPSWNMLPAFPSCAVPSHPAS